MNYLELAKEVVARAAVDGMEAEAYIEIGVETQINVDRQQVEKLSYSGSKGLGLRVLQDGKMGYAYTSNFSAESITDTIEQAQALTKAADPDPHRSLPMPEPIISAELEIFDDSIATTHIDDKVAFAMAVEKAALEYDERVMMTNRCTYSDQSGEVFLANSHGFADSYKKSVAICFTLAIGRDDDGQTQAIGFGASSSLHDLDPVAVGRKAGQRAVALLGGKPVPTQQVTVVFDPVVSAQLLVAMASALNAGAMQRGRSFLAGKMGEDVASDMVTLLDNGRLAGALGTSPFDAEGVPTRATRLIDEGVLQTLIYDHYTAQRSGGRSTGNASRYSHRTPPTLGPTNFHMQPGNQTQEEIIAGVENGFFVLNAMNTGGINPVSGEFSSAASGIWIKDGKLTDPINEVTIAASLSDMLNNITAVGNDLVFVPLFGSIGAPTLRIDTMTVGGKG
ncbi:MAG: TldD/PmbA family protein [Candidatus Promineifilaceae bacterium]